MLQLVNCSGVVFWKKIPTGLEGGLVEKVKSGVGAGLVLLLGFVVGFVLSMQNQASWRKGFW